MADSDRRPRSPAPAPDAAAPERSTTEIESDGGLLGSRESCPKCGAMLEYLPGTTRLVCEHCGASLEIEPRPQEDIEEIQFELALRRLEESRETMEARVVSCRGCGASTEVMAEVAAAHCPYCGTHFNLTGQTIRVIKPNAVVPFAIPRDTVERMLREWLEGLWFAPNALRREAEKERHVEGIYLPYWTYDAATSTSYKGARGDHYYVTVGSGKNRRSERRTRWRYAAGSVSRFFDDVLIPASASVLMTLADRLGPWRLKALVPYDPRWLAGFLSEAYRIDLRKGLEQAKLSMSATIDGDIRAQIGGDVQRIDWKQTTYAQVTFKHILLPLWVGTFRYQDKAYRFVVNGQNGNVSGERPWSRWKIVLAILAAFLVAGVLGVLLSQR